MTRFARAKGSKASNERVPEDATPWAVMKEQMQQAKQDAEHARRREQAEKQRQENYQNFLNDRKTEKHKSTWCDFSSDQSNITGNLSAKKLKDNTIEPNNIAQSIFNDRTKKKKKLKIMNYIHASSEEPEINKKKKEAKKTKSISKEPKNITQSTFDDKPKKNKEPKTEINVSASSTETNIRKKKKIKKKKDTENSSQSEEQLYGDDNLDRPEQKDIDIDLENDDQNLQKKKKKKKNRDKANYSNEKETNAAENYNNKHEEIAPSGKQTMKQKKEREGKKQRRKPGDRTFQIIINGRQVDLVRFDGFPVMKKDAERLQQLKQDMAKKGIPKKEIDRTMKLERRRAEKALARIKRDVCYNCRKGGHNLSDCPDLRSKIPPAGDDKMTDAVMADAADGVCFKCGSAEHRAGECRVQKGQQFRFASCFICKEQGHIARQCPDNPKGLYPNGGCCKLCGDVTHLRKDCPTTKTEKEESTIKLATLATADSVEAMPDASTNKDVITATSIVSKKPKKITF